MDTGFVEIPRDRIDKLTTREKDEIAKAINNFGESGHPPAAASNLHRFELCYLMSCVRAAVTFLKASGNPLSMRRHYRALLVAQDMLRELEPEKTKPNLFR